MFKRAVLLTWGLAFILAEITGIGVSYLAYVQGVSGILSGCIADMVIIIVRTLTLICIAKSYDVSLAYAVYKPLPMGRGLIILPMVVLCVIILDYLVTIVFYGSYSPQLLGINYFIEQKLLWAFPFKVGYYFSEVIVMNYMYILAKRAWPLLRPPITAGTIFLVLGWALPHILTKNVIVALYAIVLVVIFYVGYEYSKSPLTPITLWFTILIV